MTMNAEAVAALEGLHLLSGSHLKRGAELCAMEAVAWLADEPHSDHPACVCLVIGAFVRSWNDSLSDADRNQLLKPILLRLIGTRSTPAVEAKRAWMAIDWTVREFTPAWLDLAKLPEHAAALRALAPIVDVASTHASNVTLFAAREAADAAWAAAWDAARAAAGAALRPTAERLQASAVALIERMIEDGGQP